MPFGDDGSRLVALHGFTQTHHHVAGFAQAVAGRLGFATIAAPDLPGHGLSSDDRSGFDEASATLATSCGAGTYLGYSMGGRYALAAALVAPQQVRRLVLIGATAGIDDPHDAAERRRQDTARADRLERDGVDAFLEQWLSMPMFTGLPDDLRGLHRRRRNTAAGLAHSLRTAGTGSVAPMWDRTAGIDAPTLVLAGERDEKFVALGRRLAAAMPRATLSTVAQAGHAAHVERPTATLDAIAAWWSTLDA